METPAKSQKGRGPAPEDMGNRWQKADPTLALCELATELDCPVTAGQIYAEGEGYLSDLYRSVEGGAADPRPSWGDVDGLFFAALESMEQEMQK